MLLIKKRAYIVKHEVGVKSLCVECGRKKRYRFRVSRLKMEKREDAKGERLQNTNS